MTRDDVTVTTMPRNFLSRRAMVSRWRNGGGDDNGVMTVTAVVVTATAGRGEFSSAKNG